MIRLASIDDAEQMLMLYEPIVLNTAASFEYVAPTTEEFRQRIKEKLEIAPWIVFEENQSILGYAYAGLFRTRAAYQWTIEVTVNVRPDCHGKGIARKLYEKLFDLLRKQGFYTAVAVITPGNTPSIKLHEKLGFKKVGTFTGAGFKLGKWQDSDWWILELLKPTDNPQPTKKLSEIELNFS